MDMPEVRIKNAWLLRENASVYIHKLWAKEGEVLADDEWMDWKVSEYQKAWSPVEHKILNSMTELLGVTFKQNVIDVYIAPWFRAFSDPMVIGVKYTPNKFVDILTHELLHRLLIDNTSSDQIKDLRASWKDLFGNDHSFVTLVHIPVHAVHKMIYLEVLNDPSRLKYELSSLQKAEASDYIKAWDYVETHGHEIIVKQLHNLYKEKK